MKTKSLMLVLAVFAIMSVSFTSCSLFGGKDKDAPTQPQVTTPAPPATAKDRYRDLKKQKRDLVKQLKDLRKDCQWSKKADELEAQIEDLQDLIDNFDCDEQSAPAPVKRSSGVSTPKQPAAPTYQQPSAPTTISAPAPTKSTSITTTGYEGGKIRFCIRLGSADYCWLPQRLIMKGGTYQDVEDNGVGGNNWVFNAPGANDIVSVTADGTFSIKASVVDEILQQNSLQPVVEIKTNILDPVTGSAAWRFQTMSLVGDSYVCNAKSGK